MNESKYRVHTLLGNELRQMICSGQLMPGKAIWPEHTLAERYGICRNTVRRAVDKLVEDGLLKRVRGSGTFVVSSAQRRPVKHVNPHRQILYLTFSSLYSEGSFHSNSSFSQVFNGFDSVLPEYKYDMAVAHVGLDWEAPACLLNGDAAGVVFQGEVTADFYNRHLSRYPCVGVECFNPELGCNWVLLGEQIVSELAVSYLYGQGHRRIAILSDESGTGPARERLHGYRGIMARYGLEIRPEWEIYWQRPLVNGELCNEHIYLRRDYTPYLKPVLNSPEPPTAIICFDNWRASCACEALENMGFKVPGDISLTGSCNTDYCLTYNRSMRFTGYRKRMREVFAEAARLLVDILEGKSAPEGKVTILTPVFVPGDTVLPLPENRAAAERKRK